MKRLLPLFLILASCSHNNSASLEQTSLNQDSKMHHFAEIVSKVKDKAFEPQMQWVYYEGKLKAYLNVFVGEIKGVGSEALVQIKTEEGLLKFKAPILKGAQRVKIPEEVIPQIVALFEKSKEATLKLGDYETTFDLNKFQFMLGKSKKQHSLSRFKSVMIFDL
jgi:hypothetical protein